MHFRSLLTGLLIGFGIAGSVISYYADAWIDSLIRYSVLVFVGLSFFLILSLAAYYGAQSFLRHVTGLKKSPSLDAIVSDALDLVGRNPEVSTQERRDRGRQLLLKSVVWYSNLQYVRFFVTTFVAILVALGGTLGASLLYRQNMLINAQTELLHSQRNLSVINLHQQEGQRRVALYSKLEEGLTAISKASKLSWDHTKEADEELRSAREGAIATVAQSTSYFKPYWYFDVSDPGNGAVETTAVKPTPLKDLLKRSPSSTSEERISKGSLVFLSPERGILLYNAIQSSPDIFTYPVIMDFSFADVRRRHFGDWDGQSAFTCTDLRVPMTTLNLGQKVPHADFSGSTFSNYSILLAAAGSALPVMRNVTLVNTKMDVAFGNHATALDLSGARFINSVLSILDQVTGSNSKNTATVKVDLRNFTHGSCILLPDNETTKEQATNWLANALGTSSRALFKTFTHDKHDGHHRFKTK